MAGLMVTVPIRFSEKAQKDLYEMCMAYKELAETRGAENEKLRELCRELWTSCPVHDDECATCKHRDGHTGCELYDRMSELGVEVEE